MGDISKGVANTLGPSKRIYKKRIHVNTSFRDAGNKGRIAIGKASVKTRGSNTVRACKFFKTLHKCLQVTTHKDTFQKYRKGRLH
jgi:hypothetical protein